jgi:hypothetical protein
MLYSEHNHQITIANVTQPVYGQRQGHCLLVSENAEWFTAMGKQTVSLTMNV